MTKEAKKAERRIEYMHLGSLKLAKRNPKDHDMGAIEASVKRFGYVAPVLLDERTGRLVGGHGRVQLLERLYRDRKDAPEGVKVDPEGDWLVPVVRGWSSLSDKQAEAYLLADNRVGELGGWNNADLEALLRDLAPSGDLEGTGYTGDDLDELIASAAGDNAEEAEPQEEEQKPSEKPWVKLGELYKLGPHRLYVGDSFNAADRAKLFGDATIHAVVTDPPYAIYGSSTGIGADIADDKMVRPFFTQLFEIAHALIPKFGQVYTACDWRTYHVIVHTARAAGLTLKNCIVWDKGGGGLGSNWANAHEFIAYFSKMPEQKAMQSNTEKGQRSVFKPNIQRHNRPHGDERRHNAAKPVALMREFVDAATDKGQAIFEPFAGSGSTLLAAHQLERVCYAMELEPKYAQIVIERWQKLTGEKAEVSLVQ